MALIIHFIEGIDHRKMEIFFFWFRFQRKTKKSTIHPDLLFTFLCGVQRTRQMPKIA
jgi:hypothetical protein